MSTEQKFIQHQLPAFQIQEDFVVLEKYLQNRNRARTEITVAQTILTLLSIFLSSTTHDIVQQFPMPLFQGGGRDVELMNFLATHLDDFFMIFTALVGYNAAKSLRTRLELGKSSKYVQGELDINPDNATTMYLHKRLTEIGFFTYMTDKKPIPYNLERDVLRSFRQLPTEGDTMLKM